MALANSTEGYFTTSIPVTKRAAYVIFFGGGALGIPKLVDTWSRGRIHYLLDGKCVTCLRTYTNEYKELLFGLWKITEYKLCAIRVVDDSSLMTRQLCHWRRP